jgi:hypothetical protein
LFKISVCAQYRLLFLVLFDLIDWMVVNGK